MHRGKLHRYCRRLTGNVWDGEDLMQDEEGRVYRTVVFQFRPLNMPVIILNSGARLFF